MTIRPYNAPKLDLQNVHQVNIATVIPTLKENDINYLIVEGENFRMDFDKHDGFLCRYDVNGMTMLKEDGKLTPNFWRAPTDNDMGSQPAKQICRLERTGIETGFSDKQNRKRHGNCQCRIHDGCSKKPNCI